MGLFVVRDCALRLVLLEFYPLMRHSLIWHHLASKMVEERFLSSEVRSSELDAGLSSKPTTSSSSKPFQALIEDYVFEGKHLKNFRRCFQFLIETKIGLPRPGEKGYAFAHSHMCFQFSLCSSFSYPPLHSLVTRLFQGCSWSTRPKCVADGRECHVDLNVCSRG